MEEEKDEKKKKKKKKEKERDKKKNIISQNSLGLSRQLSNTPWL